MKITFTLLLLVSGIAFGSTMTCSNYNGQLQHLDWTYEGGPAPAPGIAVHRTTWVLGGKIIGQFEQREGEPSPSLPFTVTEGKSQPLESLQTNISVTTTSFREVTLRDNAGKELAHEFLICKDVAHFYP